MLPVVPLPPMVQLHMYHRCLGYCLVHCEIIFCLEKNLIQGGTFTRFDHFVLLRLCFPKPETTVDRCLLFCIFNQYCVSMFIQVRRSDTCLYP
jgi:hypothetical protein